jgi:hypothetical protein
MMTRQAATFRLREELNKHGLSDWSVRLNQKPDSRYLGLCSYADKCIILSAHHIDIHPEPDVINTILHEVAHALCPGQGHNHIWAAKAREIGCDNTSPCSNLSLSPEIIDAIRSGADVEVTFEEQVIRTPSYKITRLQDKCEVCGKVAKSVKETVVKSLKEDKPDLKIIYLECGHVIQRSIPKGTPFHKLQMGGDPNCNHTWDKNNCVKCSRKRPFDFQIEGMKFIERGLATQKGVGCFDDMGLGKTIQAGGVVHFNPLTLQPCLWIVKSGLKYQTALFIMQWLGDVPFLVTESRGWFPKKGSNFKHFIIGYDMLVQKKRVLKSGKKVESGFDISRFDEVGIKCVILDECQQIKNVDSSRTQMVRRVVRDRKVIPLSGTPWNNRGNELFPVLNMMDPVKFYSDAAFDRTWVQHNYVGNRVVAGGIRNIASFREFTRDLIIRRERVEVMPELPLVNRTKLNVEMDPATEREYDHAVEEFVKWYTQEAEEIGGMHLLAALSKMRHLAGLAKIPATLDYVDEFVEDTDRKLVIFAHHIDVQEDLFKEITTRYGSQFPVLKIFGSDPPLRRHEVAMEFNAAPRAILVASALAAGEGLNLQTCADMVMHERQWNPGKEQQCEDRFPRPGTTATSINAVYTHLNGITAVDAKFDEIVERKRVNFHNTMNKTEMPAWNENSLMKELADAIVNAYNAKKNRQIAAKG